MRGFANSLAIGRGGGDSLFQANFSKLFFLLLLLFAEIIPAGKNFYPPPTVMYTRWEIDFYFEMLPWT